MFQASLWESPNSSFPNGSSGRNCSLVKPTAAKPLCNNKVNQKFRVMTKKTKFKNSTLHEVDFTETDLTEAVFDNCDLKRATFERTNLEKADFRNALNYSIDLEQNRIKKAKFSKTGIVGLLGKYDIVIE